MLFRDILFGVHIMLALVMLFVIVYRTPTNSIYVKVTKILCKLVLVIWLAHSLYLFAFSSAEEFLSFNLYITPYFGSYIIWFFFQCQQVKD